MNKKILICLLTQLTMLSLAAKEVELSRIYIQRRDQVEFNWGAENDVGELTYAVNGDGSVSLYVGTEDGTKKVVDTDTITVAKVVELDPDNYVIYPDPTDDLARPIIMKDENVFSIWNTISAGATNDEWTVGFQTSPRHLNIQSLNPNVKIVEVHCDKFEKPGVPSGDSTLPISRSSTAINDAHEGKPDSVHKLDFTSVYPSGNNTPPSCVVSNFVVYGTIGNVGTSEIDSSKVNIEVKEVDGRSYHLGSVHRMIEGIHYTQDRWAYYPAHNDVQLNTKHLMFGNYNNIQGVGNTVKFNGVLGTIMEYNGGIGTGWNISDIKILTTNDTVRLLVDASVGQQVVLKYKDALNDANWTVLTPGTNYTDSYPNTVTVNELLYYELLIPMNNKDQGFFTLAINTPQDPFIKLNTDVTIKGTKMSPVPWVMTLANGSVVTNMVLMGVE